MISAFGEKPKIMEILFLCTSLPSLKIGVRVEGIGIFVAVVRFHYNAESIRIPESIWELLLSGEWRKVTWCQPSPLLPLDSGFPTIRSADLPLTFYQAVNVLSPVLSLK